MNEVNSVLHHVKEIAKLAASSSVVKMLPDFVNNDSSFWKRNLKRGFAYYLVDESSTALFDGYEHSNFSNFSNDKVGDGIKNLVDDSVFFGLASAVNETTDLTPSNWRILIRGEDGGRTISR